MCGIAGYRSHRLIDPSVLQTMVDGLTHRGPDAEGFYRGNGFSAGMRRLRINDLETGDQPLYSEDKAIVLLYNGEIYNSPELRKGLTARGHEFRTHSDGEVICHLYEEEGTLLFEKLDGMFACALFDTRRRRLILSRDLAGEKPLFYGQIGPGELVFASEIRSLRRFPLLSLSLDRQSLWDFPTFLWIPEPASVYSEVRAVPRGHVLTVDDNGIELFPYRNLFNSALRSGGEREIVAETRRVVEDAVKSRLLSDVPVGSFLSGGLDSSIVATVARRELEELSTFSVAFEDVADPYHGHANEADAAAEYAALLGTKHHEIHATAATFRADLDTFCKHGDQPFAVSSGLGILAVARAAREAGIKVLLGGDGADEAFGGYSWYPQIPRVDLFEPLESHPHGTVSFQNTGLPVDTRLAVMGAFNAPERAWAWHYYAHEKEKAALFSADMMDNVESSLRHFGPGDAQWTPEEVIAQDRAFYFPNEMLRKVDLMTMAFSVEGRTPFAAPAVQSHAAKLKYSELVRGETLKWVLRRAFDDILPSEITTRPKHGFNVPIDRWLANEWSDLVDETFAEGSALRREGLIRRDSGETARRMLADPARLNGHSIFCFVMLNRWLEQAKCS